MTGLVVSSSGTLLLSTRRGLCLFDKNTEVAIAQRSLLVTMLSRWGFLNKMRERPLVERRLLARKKPNGHALKEAILIWVLFFGLRPILRRKMQGQPSGLGSPGELDGRSFYLLR